MAGETEVFRCRCCGQIAPVVRLTEEGPFPLERKLQTFGGKRKLTDEQREARRGRPFKRGGAPGIIDYQELDMSDELVALFEKRIEELS